MRCFSLRYAALVALMGCGQSSDTIGPRVDKPEPIVEDTGWVTDFEPCAGVLEEAAPLPTSLFLTVDKSCSMDDPAGGDTGITTATTKWEATSAAFGTFFADPDVVDLNVALRLWPDNNDGCNETDCDATACSQPQVPIDLVGNPGHRQALTDTLVNTTPEGSTPMSAALDGAAIWAQQRLADWPDEEVAIVLVTDGEPTACDEDIANISAIAASSAAAGVPVYAVGIEGSNTAQIDQIAAAGATGVGYYVGSANAEAELVAALEDIQSQAVSCRFSFPTESTGEPLSPDLVRVEYDENGVAMMIPRVVDAAACVPDGGWYLNDNQNPTTINLCGTTCREVQAILTISIEVAVGCECLIDDDCPGDDVCSDEGCVPPRPELPGKREDLVFGGKQAVQGGALTCSSAPLSAAWWMGLVALVAIRRERREC